MQQGNKTYLTVSGADFVVLNTTYVDSFIVELYSKVSNKRTVYAY